MGTHPFLYISNFNWLHNLMIISLPFFIFGSTKLLNHKSQAIKDRFLWGILWTVVAAYVITFIIDWFTKTDQRTHILERLPLQLCGISVFLYPVIFKLRHMNNQSLYRWFLAYLYFVASPAALLGILMPSSDCIYVSLLTYNSLTYFYKHYMLFCFPILLCTLGYYRPKAKDMFRATASLIVLMSIIHLVNLIFTSIGGYPVNYFYTEGPDGNPILSLFWKLIPVPWLYMFPTITVVVPMYFLYYVPFYFFPNKKP